MSALPIENKVNTVSFYDPKSEAEAKRKKQLAEILIQQGNAPFKNEMAGGMTVARSPWENINQGAQKYMGEFKLAQADDRQAELDANRQKGMAEALSKWGENPQEAAMMLAQDPRYADMAAKILGGEVDYGRQKERWAQQDALQREQLAALNQRASMGGSTPAAMQVANRMYELQMIASDPNRSPEERMAAQTQYNLIGQAHKTFGFDRGMEKSFFDPNQPNVGQPVGQPNMNGLGFVDVAGDGVYNIADEGNLPPLEDNMPVNQPMEANNQVPQPMPVQPIVQPVQGFGETQANFASQKKGAEERAKLLQQLELSPQIKTAEESAKSGAATQSELNERLASMPQLMDTVAKLSELGQNATYTLAGQGANFLRKEAGMSPSEGAIARKEYTALVDNQILPLLRQTFGAQFTQKEGESLKQTLGDVNASPQEKDAVLRSFIDQKIATIQTMQRQRGLPLSSIENPMMPPTAQPQIAVNPQTGERMINRGNGWEPYNGQ
jgi:hypothetical protein